MRTGSRPRVRVTTSHPPSGGNLRGCGESNPDVLLCADQCAQGRQRLSDGREPVGQSLTALALATSSRTGGEVPCVTRTVGMYGYRRGGGAREASGGGWGGWGEETA